MTSAWEWSCMLSGVLADGFRRLIRRNKLCSPPSWSLSTQVLVTQTKEPLKLLSTRTGSILQTSNGPRMKRPSTQPAKQRSSSAELWCLLRSQMIDTQFRWLASIMGTLKPSPRLMTTMSWQLTSARLSLKDLPCVKLIIRTQLISQQLREQLPTGASDSTTPAPAPGEKVSLPRPWKRSSQVRLARRKALSLSTLRCTALIVPCLKNSTLSWTTTNATWTKRASNVSCLTT